MASKRSEITALVRGLDGNPVTTGTLQEIQSRCGPVSEGYLRKLLRELDVPLDALVEGVRQDSFHNLERTLLTLADLYEQGAQAQTRKLVMRAKDHARLAERGAPATGVKTEMILWMLTWLENPALFSAWLALRKRAVTEFRPLPPG